MPTNVSPEYKAAEARLRAAQSDEERLAALEQMASSLNKHKGTEKLYSDIKKRIKALREQAETHAAKRGSSFKVAREGAAQVALIGEPNAGKSTLLSALTNATPEIAAYPFTTRAPVPGMMPFADIALQLVDLPPISPEYVESWVFDVVRTADAVLLVFSLANEEASAAIDRVRATLLERAKATLLGRDDVLPEGGRLAAKRAVLVGTHLDQPGAGEMLERINERYPAFDVLGVDRGSIDPGALAGVVYARLDLVRVYAKTPGRVVDVSKPFVFKRGARLPEFAARVHEDLAERLAYARVWGAGASEVRRVPRDYLLAEGDVIELHV